MQVLLVSNEPLFPGQPDGRLSVFSYYRRYLKVTGRVSPDTITKSRHCKSGIEMRVFAIENHRRSDIPHMDVQRNRADGRIHTPGTGG